MVSISVAALIAVVKSSLALSLGLVGALSVVRFRTAIKEPYNLSFLLLSNKYLVLWDPFAWVGLIKNINKKKDV